MRNRDCGKRICTIGTIGWVMLGALALALALLPSCVIAQLNITTVQGTVYRADGTPAGGTLLVSWSAFTTPQNQAVAAGKLSASIGSDGFVSVNLMPNAGALPTGSYYTAVYHLNDGTVNTEYWIVPASGTVSIASARAQLEPSTIAVQPVSKSYIDSALASFSGSWLPLTGGSLTGPLTLSSDPATSGQAVTKHYADTLAASALPLAGGTLTGPLTLAADPSTSLQAATRRYVDSGVSTAQATANAAQATANAALPATGGTANVKQLNGMLYADQMQSRSGSNDGIQLSLSDCLTFNYACQVIAPATYGLTEPQPWGGSWQWIGSGRGIAQGPAALAPPGCFTDDRFGGPEMICTPGVPPLSPTRFQAGPSITMNVTSTPPALSAYTAPALVLNHTFLNSGFNSWMVSEINSTDLMLEAVSDTPGGSYGINLTSLHNSPGDAIGYFEANLDRGGVSSGDNEGQEDKFIHSEAPDVFQGSIRSISTSPSTPQVCTSPCTIFNTTQTQGNPGSLGAGLALIDLTHADSSGYISAIGAAGSNSVTATGADWDSAFGDSNAHTVTTVPISNTGSTNSFPESAVAVSVANATGFTTGKACLFSSSGATWECEPVTAVDTSANTVTFATLNQPFESGSVIAQGGMTGMGFELTADEMTPGGPFTNPDALPTNIIRTVWPVMYNLGGNTAYLISGTGYGFSYAQTRAYASMGSGGSVTANLSGQSVASCSASGGSGYSGGTDLQRNLIDTPRLSYTVNSGATPPVLALGGTGPGGSLRYCNVISGGSGITSIAVTLTPRNGYAVYPMTRTLNVWNPSTGGVDGSSIATDQMMGIFQAGDIVEQEHYYATQFPGERVHVVQYQTGNKYLSILSGEIAGFHTMAAGGASIINGNSPYLYTYYPAGSMPSVTGNGKMTTPYGYALDGPWRNGLLMKQPPFGANSQNGAVSIGCRADNGANVCATWVGSYNIVSAANQQGGGNAEDVFQYNPTTYSWQWTAGAASTMGANPYCTANLTGSSTGGFAIACNGHTSKIDTSGNLSLPGQVRAQGGVTGATINGEVTVDGTTYTTLNAAWSVAVAQASATGRDQTVRLGPGTYPVTATLSEPANGACVNLLGSGGTTVNADSTQVVTTLTVPNTLNGDLFYLGNSAQAQGCTFRDLNILASANATHGFELQWFRGLLMDNVTVNDTTAEGVLLGEEDTSAGHQSNFLIRNVTVSYSSSVFTPANRSAYGIHLLKTAMDSHLDDVVVRNALTAAVYNEGTGNTGYLIHGFGYPYTCTTAPCSNSAGSSSAPNASYATSYVIYDTGGSGSVWTDTYADSPATAAFYVGANGVAIHGGHIQWPDLTSFPAANLAYVASAVSNNLLVADIDCLGMASAVNWITYAAPSGTPPTYSSVHHLTGCGNYYQALEPAEVTGFSSGGANINDASGAVPRVWSTPVASAASYPAYSAQMYTGYQGDAFQAHFSGSSPFFNVTYQGTVRSNGGIALSTIMNTSATLTLTAANKNVIANASGGAQTITLPSCYTPLPDRAAPTGLELTIIKSDGSSNSVTLQTVSSQNINYNGASAPTLSIGSAGRRTLVCGPDYNWYAY